VVGEIVFRFAATVGLYLDRVSTTSR